MKDDVLDIRTMTLKMIDQIRRQDRVYVVDLSDIYRKETAQIFTDHIHTTREAKPIVVEMICNNIIPIVRKDLQ